MPAFSTETIVEAMLFAASDPVPAARLAQAAEIQEQEVHEAVRTLNLHYEQQGRAFRISEISGGYQFRTLPALAEYVRGLSRNISAHRLSSAALETLAIVAYRQPISRTGVEKIRGVNVSGVLKTLIEKRLITVCGRAQVLGRPLLYGTTAEFLRHFGLAALGDLPRESELEVILGEQAALRADSGDKEAADQEPEQQQTLM
ncbi:MAG: SMC-Scp complex subunit ScpB [Candidatus Glassbacteria bacterium]